VSAYHISFITRDLAVIVLRPTLVTGDVCTGHHRLCLVLVTRRLPARTSNAENIKEVAVAIAYPCPQHDDFVK